MQVLKKEVRNRIVQAAYNEFGAFGFDKASMRGIAHNARMTVGNLYRYYKNKEDLFSSVVEPLYEKLMELKIQLSGISNNKVNWLVNQFKDLQKEYRSEWLILNTGAKGSGYEDAVKEIYSLLENSLTDSMKKTGRDPRISGPIAAATLTGMSMLLKADDPDSDRLVDEFLSYIMADFLKKNVA